MSFGSVLKGAIAQVDPFDNGATYGTYNNGIHAKPPTTTTIKAPAVKTPSYDPNSDITALQKAIADQQASYAQLQAQQAAQPRLPVYDTSAAYANAQKAATAAVDPVYTDKLNQYLQQEQLGTTIQTRKTGEAVSDIATNLGNETADNATNRTRTAADEATNVGDVGQTETNFQQDSGTAFDRARTALTGKVANSGLTTSGIGQGEVAAATADRNQAEKEQTQNFDSSRRDIHTAAQRTFEDLATSDTRNTAAAATGTTRTNQQLQDYIDNANLEEQQFRTGNEQERQAAIAAGTNDQYKTGVQQFIASLVGSGARAQDVALAAQVYGA